MREESTWIPLLRQILVSYAVRKPEVGYCLAMDHEVLTNRGFLSMHEVRDRLTSDAGFLVAGFDAATQHFVYEKPDRFILTPAQR